jgi:signal recognition particle subunit SRP54
MQPDEREITRTVAIINSMTPKERRDHNIINGSRRKRIAMGSGTTVADVNRLLKNFTAARKMMKSMTRGRGKKGLRNLLPV